jgi:FMN-dependent NADH-azoreductase
MKLLHIDSSILGEQSASRELSAAIVRRELRAHPGIEVSYRDLASDALPHLSSVHLAKTDAKEAKRSAEALDEFVAADVVVIGAPMYNFSVPSQLKAWIDRILVAGKTFRYSEKGPEGLVGGKRVILAVTRGGVTAPGAGTDFLEDYLRHVFLFIGVANVSVVGAEGLSLSPDHRRSAMAAAHARIDGPAARAA